MADDQIPLLWITGPAGVGKSVVCWQIFTELAQAGFKAAFADTDQLCMCYPAPPGDPGRERIKAQNLASMLSNYQAMGARCVIANGVLDPVNGVDSNLLQHADVTVCRLRADRADLVRRFVGRHEARDDLDDAVQATLSEASAMDASVFADVCVDTSGATVSQVVGLVRDRCHEWPGASGKLPRRRVASGGETTAAGHDEPDGADGHVVLLCGPSGVGKSTIGFDLYTRYLRAGRTAGYIDLDQIGFLLPGGASDPGHHLLKARNLAAMWRTYHAAGARHLVVTGPVPSQAAGQVYVDALPAATVTICRLHAGYADLRTRVMSRATGGSWPQPGDPLRGQPPEYLSRMADRAAADAQALDRAGIGVRIDTDGLTVAAASDLIAAVTDSLLTAPAGFIASTAGRAGRLR